MKISKSKQELARIISENGGWRDEAEFSAQDKDGEVFHYAVKPTIYAGCEVWHHTGCIGEGEFTAETLPNWHQTILSRAEYFHLYPAPDADVGSLSAALDLVTDENKHEHVDGKPTIEQLAADYQQAVMLAEIKQHDADAAKADADARLKALELAGEALGLLVSPITSKQDPELVIEFKVGDEVECVESNIKRYNYNGMVGRLRTIDESDTSTPYLVDFGGEGKIWCHKVKFIRRP